MIDLHIVALLLLVGRILTIIFISMVLKRQISLSKIPIHEEIRRYRERLLTLSVVIALAQFIPVIIDTVTLFSNIETHTNNSLGIAYAASNNISQLISAILIWSLYHMSGTPRTARTRKDD